jgi:hypothetical protein
VYFSSSSFRIKRSYFFVRLTESRPVPYRVSNGKILPILNEGLNERLNETLSAISIASSLQLVVRSSQLSKAVGFGRAPRSFIPRQDFFDGQDLGSLVSNQMVRHFFSGNMPDDRQIPVTSLQSIIDFNAGGNVAVRKNVRVGYNYRDSRWTNGQHRPDQHVRLVEESRHGINIAGVEVRNLGRETRVNNQDDQKKIHATLQAMDELRVRYKVADLPQKFKDGEFDQTNVQGSYFVAHASLLVRHFCRFQEQEWS